MVGFPALMNAQGQSVYADPVVIVNPDGSLGATGGASSFGPTPFSFTGPNQTFSFPCAGAAALMMYMTDNFTGTITTSNSVDTNAATVGPARLSRSGAGSLGKSTITGTGAAHEAQYRVVLGGSLFVMKTGADFVGTASGVVFATASPAMVLVNGAVHTADEEAVRAGRAYTTTTGIGTVAGGNHIVLYMSNPASSGVRLFIPTRRFTASRQDTLVAVAPQFYGMKNPTTNIPAGVATVSNRGAGVASPIVARFAVVNDTNLPSGGTVAAGNLASTPDLPFERTLEPGEAFCQIMSNTSSAGLGGAITMLMCITAAFYQEPI